MKLDTNFSFADVQAWIGGICQCGTATIDTNGNTAYQVAASNGKTSPEQGKSSIVVFGARQVFRRNNLKFRGEDDGHDDSVDGNDFAKDNGDQVLRSYTRGLDTAADDG